MTGRTIRLGTRGSALALTQARGIAAQLTAAGWTVEVTIIHTTGDRIADRAFVPADGTGVFVAEIERALLDHTIDLAVHSLKDLPAEMAPGLTLAAISAREDPRDVLVGRTAPTLAQLPARAVVGTSSLRRRAQLRARRPDLALADMRGNVDTRLRKLDAGRYDAICLAAAGLHRLGLAPRITEYFPVDTLVPAVGQGALALQSRAGDALVISACAPLHDAETARAVAAERTVLAALGCAVPLGVLGTVRGEQLTLIAALGSPDGARIVRHTLTGSEGPAALGLTMAAALRTASMTAEVEHGHA